MENIQKYLDEIKPEVIKKRYELEIKMQRNIFISSFCKKNIYEIADFTKYDNMDFIINSFVGILNRYPAESEISNYLNILDSGIDKIRILSNIRFSPEGKINNVEILGLKNRKFLFNLEKIPFFGKTLKVIICLTSIAKMLSKIDKLESKLYKLEEENKILTNQLNLDVDKLELEMYKIYQKVILDNNEASFNSLVEDLSKKTDLIMKKDEDNKIELLTKLKEYNEIRIDLNNVQNKNKELEECFYNFKKAWFN